MKTCKNCKYFIVMMKKLGFCTNEKTKESIHILGDNVVIYASKEPLIVSEDFGCIHHEEKE